MASNLNNNGSFTVSSSAIQLRANSGGVPLSHNDVDSNFENLRLAHNSVVTALAGKSASSHTHSNASTTSHGFMSSTDKNKLNGIATSANNYSLPTASSSGLGGVKIGSNINISSGVISVPLASTTVAGVVEYDNNTIKKNSSGQLYVNQGAVNTNTTYSAGSGITLSGTTFSHKDTSSQASSNNSGRTYIQDIILDGYGHVTGINTATETVVNTDTNTTYSAGGGLSLSGTTFSHSNTSSAGSVNNSGNTVIQDITVDTYGHVTAIASKTIETSSGTNPLVFAGNSSGTLTNMGRLGEDITSLKFIGMGGLDISVDQEDGLDNIELDAGMTVGSSTATVTFGSTHSGEMTDPICFQRYVKVGKICHLWFTVHPDPEDSDHTFLFSGNSTNQYVTIMNLPFVPEPYRWNQSGYGWTNRPDWGVTYHDTYFAYTPIKMHHYVHDYYGLQGFLDQSVGKIYIYKPAHFTSNVYESTPIHGFVSYNIQ